MRFIFMAIAIGSVTTVSGIAVPVLPAQTRIRGPNTGAVDSLLVLVVDVRNRPVEDALVTISDTLGTWIDTARVTAPGRYVSRPKNWPLVVTVSAPGYGTSTHGLPAIVQEDEVVLNPLRNGLALIRVVGSRRVRATAPQQLASGVGAVDKALSGSAGNILPGSYGDNVAGIAELTSGASVNPTGRGLNSGISVLGLSPDQSSVVVDGVVSPGATLPRDASVAIRVSTSTYDPSRGGFSGAQVDISTLSGSNISTRYLDLSEAGDLSTTPVAGATDISGSTSGVLVLDHVFYSGSVEASDRRVGLVGLGSNGFVHTTGTGLSTETGQSVATVLDSLGLLSRNIAKYQQNQDMLGAGRLDFVRDTNLTLSIEGRLALNSVKPGFYEPFAAVGAFGQIHAHDAGLSATLTQYIGTALNETRIGFGDRLTRTSPYTNAPLVTVRTGDPGDVEEQTITAGSELNPSEATDYVTTTVSHSIRWNLLSNNAMHAGLDWHTMRSRAMPSVNDLGSFNFDSLAALRLETPASYERVFQPSDSKAHTSAISSFLGDIWTPSHLVSVELGGRVDVSHVGIPFQPDLAPIARGTRGATSVDLSPRLGVNVNHPLGNVGPIAAFSLRGGVGRFVNEPSPDAIIDASIPVTGPLAATRLTCVGAATPSPTFSNSTDEATASYTSCLDGTEPSALQRMGYLLADDWKPPATWRGNFGTSVQLRNHITLTGDIIVSRTNRVSSLIASNLALQPAFVLPAEQDRPVFESPDTVAANAEFATGVPRRIDASLGPLAMISSDLRSRSNQLSLGAQYWTLTGVFLQAQYALTHAAEETRGLASASGDPRDREWSPSAFQPTQTVTLSAFRQFGSRVSASIAGRIQSGLRYTPTVNGDLNGDGLSNDRPFVFSPDAYPDTSYSHAMSTLLAHAPAPARSCLDNALNRIIGRNACQGPWTTRLDGHFSLALGFGPMQVRPALRLDLLNIAAGGDWLLHGTNHMHGWGGLGLPDPLLYTVTGFDVSQRRYAYQVNPAFGATGPRSAYDNPFEIRVSVVLPLYRDPVAQQLSIDTRRKARPTVSELVDRYVDEYPNAALDIVLAADTIGLRQQQRDTLTVLARQFDNTMRAIWTPVAKAIAANPAATDLHAHRVQAARTPAAINYEEYRQLVLKALDASQIARLPGRPRFALSANALRAMGWAP